MSHPKEVHFFDRHRFGTGEPYERSYHKAGWGETAPTLDETVLYGESTPKYVLLDWLGRSLYLQFIRDYNPQIKLIVLFRNPVDRAYSQWNMMRRKRGEIRTFERTIQRELLRRPSSGPQILLRGHYGTIVENILALFPRENCLFLRVENLNMQLPVVEQFLGLPAYTYTSRYCSRHPYPAPMAAATQHELLAYYDEEMAKLAQLTSIDTSDWRI